MIVEKGVTTDSLTYDLAGNLIERKTQRGHTISHAYDVLGRLRRTVTPSASYSSLPGALNVFPAETFAAATDTFAYDVMGNIVLADNPQTKIRRHYTRSGLLAADTLSIKNWGNSTFGHVFGLQFNYDLDGRRVALHHPAGISPGTDMTRYVYDAATAQLDTLIDANGESFSFHYDADGLLRRRTYPGGTQASKDTLAYDADHRLTYHRVTVDGTVKWTDGLSYDHRGKVTNGGMTYTGLGYLEDPGNFQWGLAGEALNWESFVTNGLGQVITRGGQDFFTGLPFEKTYYTNVDGDVYQIVEDWTHTGGSPATDWEAAISASNTDVSGNREFASNYTHSWSFNGDSTFATKLATFRDEARSYYSADQRLMAHRLHRDTVDISQPTDTLDNNTGVYDEYWYDALGRRVLKRSYQDGSVCDRGVNYCYSSIERYAWDGDQVLWETRQGGTGDVANPSNGDQTGKIGYLHAIGIDAPVSMIRNGETIVLHRNWRGTYDLATNTDGDRIHCAPTQTVGCDFFPWPGWSALAFPYTPILQKTHIWYGSLPLDQFDESGLAYRRNRYYDPVSAQFTQQDPIGIAGGLNLYGYANGDPVNYSDPFGLKADTIDAEIQAQLGNACEVADCDAAKIITPSDEMSILEMGIMAGVQQTGRAVTIGNNIYMGSAPDPSNRADVALVAHELVHTVQSQSIAGSPMQALGTYLMMGAIDQGRYLTGLGNPYTGSGFLEPAAQRVQRCFLGGSCAGSIFRPGG